MLRKCILKHIIVGNVEGGIEVKWREGRRRKQLTDKFKETKGYWKLKEEALDRTVCRTGFGRGFGPVDRMRNEYRKQHL